MNPRYTDPKIEVVFSENRKYQLWLLVESALIESLAPESVWRHFYGVVEGLTQDIGAFVALCKEEEKLTRHDVGAFLNVLEDRVGPTGAAQYLHRGFTSSDVVDTALSVQISGAIQRASLLKDDFHEAFKDASDSQCVGYTHGMPAESFFLSSRYQRTYNDLNNSFTWLKPHMTGPLGDAKHLEIGSRINVAKKLGFYNQDDGRAPAQPNFMQCSERADLARLATQLAVNGGVLAKLATDMRLLVFKGELGRVKSGSEMGSSAMPHKTNPADLEKVCGLARTLRGHALVAMENIELWLERDISHSSTERLWISEAFHVYCHMLTTMTEAVRSYKPTPLMQKNLEDHAEELQTAARVIALQKTGVGRREAWLTVKELAGGGTAAGAVRRL